MANLSFAPICILGDTYHITKELGKGEFGTVYHVKNAAGTNNFAMKKLEKVNTSMLDSAMGEIEDLSALSHDNIVRVITAFKNNSEVCIVMELMEGSVKSYMESSGGRLYEEHAKLVTKDAVQGLIYLHQHNVIHRDIRCDNILIDQNKRAKLADMGIAKISGGGDINYSDLTSHRTGIPYWQAPEIIDGTEQPGCKSDVWMLGITVWEMMEGQPPRRDLDLKRFLFQIRVNPRHHLEILLQMNQTMMSGGLTNFLERIFVQRDERPDAEGVAAHNWLQ